MGHGIGPQEFNERLIPGQAAIRGQGKGFEQRIRPDAGEDMGNGTAFVVTALGAGLATWWWGWPLGGALVFGLCLSVASTVVLVRAMETHGQLKTINGHIAIGWLVVEDLAMVLVLV